MSQDGSTLVDVILGLMLGSISLVAVMSYAHLMDGEMLGMGVRHVRDELAWTIERTLQSQPHGYDAEKVNALKYLIFDKSLYPDRRDKNPEITDFINAAICVPTETLPVKIYDMQGNPLTGREEATPDTDGFYDLSGKHCTSAADSRCLIRVTSSFRGYCMPKNAGLQLPDSVEVLFTIRINPTAEGKLLFPPLHGSVHLNLVDLNNVKN